MTNKLIVIINSLKVAKIKKILLYETTVTNNLLVSTDSVLLHLSADVTYY